VPEATVGKSFDTRVASTATYRETRRYTLFEIATALFLLVLPFYLFPLLGFYLDLCFLTIGVFLRVIKIYLFSIFIIVLLTQFSVCSSISKP
jgi:hypothetical protein